MSNLGLSLRTHRVRDLGTCGLTSVSFFPMYVLSVPLSHEHLMHQFNSFLRQADPNNPPEGFFPDGDIKSFVDFGAINQE